MELELQYDNETDIPEGFASLYKQVGGKWVLSGIKGIKTTADVDKVKGALDKERKDRQAAETKLKKFEKLGDRDPDELLKLTDEVEELKVKLEASGTGGKKNAEEQQKIIDAAVARALGPVQRELATAKTDLEKSKGETELERTTGATLKGRIKQSAIEQALTKAAIDSKVKDTAIGDVLMHAGVFDVEEDAETGKILAIKTKDGVGVTPGLDVSGWLTDRKGDKTHWWAESVGGGGKGGAGGKGGGDNPFNLKSWNMTAASKLTLADRSKAEAMAKAAGHESPEAAFSAAARAGL